VTEAHIKLIVMAALAIWLIACGYAIYHCIKPLRPPRGGDDDRKGKK
jgi:hypothetical protein